MKDLSKERVSPEVTEKAKRRQFSNAYKQRILSEADSCTRLGEVGKLLRREGLYSSHLANWRKQRKEGSMVCRRRNGDERQNQKTRSHLKTSSFVAGTSDLRND